MYLAGRQFFRIGLGPASSVSFMFVRHATQRTTHKRPLPSEQVSADGEFSCSTWHCAWSAGRTVWYELLSGEWPWKEQPAEATIWLVGRGMKQSLANIQASRDVKVRHRVGTPMDVRVRVWDPVRRQGEGRPTLE